MILPASISPCRCYLKETLVPLGQKLYCGLIHQPFRQYDGLAMKSLNRVLQCRAIAFLENIGTNFDDSIRSHRKEESIKGRMMQTT